MSKVYLLSEADFADLLRRLDRRTPQLNVPQHDTELVPADAQARIRTSAFDEAHRFYNYQVQQWLQDVQK